jgi:hypothetical protein
MELINTLQVTMNFNPTLINISQTETGGGDVFFPHELDRKRAHSGIEF